MLALFFFLHLQYYKFFNSKDLSFNLNSVEISQEFTRISYERYAPFVVPLLSLFEFASVSTFLSRFSFKELDVLSELKEGRWSEMGFTHNQREPVSIQEITLNTPVLLYKKTDPVFGWVTSSV
jgi:hypothetical protein